MMFKFSREKKLNVLFLFYEATRTGAPLVLLEILKKLKEKGNLNIHILLDYDRGPLLSEFQNFESFSILHRSILGLPQNNPISRVVNRLRLYFIKAHLKKLSIDLIYANTVVMGYLLEVTRFLTCPIITHIHELDFVINLFPKRNIESVLRYSDKLIAVSKAVKENLIRNHNANESIIRLIHGCPIVRKSSETEVGITNKETFTVGASGTIEFRKGTDLFIQVASYVQNKYSELPIEFQWIGGSLETEDGKKIKYDLDKLELKNTTFIKQVSNPNEYYRNLNTFLMISREDPFPLVMLEVGELGVPLVGFENSGGYEELAEDNCGIVVPYSDIVLMAEKVVELYYNKKLRDKLSGNIQKKVKNNFTVDKIACLVEHEIFETIKHAKS